MDITAELKKLRPTLSEGSLKTYTSILRSLHSKIFGGSIEKKDYDDSKKILDFLKDVPCNKKNQYYLREINWYDCDDSALLFKKTIEYEKNR